MKKSIYIIACTLLSIATLAQSNNYFYVGDSAYYWTTDSSSVIFIVKNMENYNAIVNNLNNIFKETTDEILEDDEDDNIILYSNSLRNINLNSLVSAISTKSDDISFASYSKIIGDEHLWLRNEVYIKLSDITKYNQYLVDLFSTYSVISSNFEGDNEYLLKFENEQLMMQFANRFNDSSWVVYSTPDFYSDIVLSSNDTHYSEQWGIKNTGQEGGTAGVDVNAEKAWSFLQSSIGTIGLPYTVAVIDDGVENLNGGYFSKYQ